MDMLKSLNENIRYAKVIARRRFELAYYAKAIADLPEDNGRALKQTLKYKRRLAQPDAYEILSLIWMASPFAVGESDWGTTQSDLTVYRLEKQVREINPYLETKNAIPAIIQAAIHFGLVERTSEGKKRPLWATTLLHEMLFPLLQTSAAWDGMTIAYYHKPISEEWRALYGPAIKKDMEEQRRGFPSLTVVRQWTGRVRPAK